MGDSSGGNAPTQCMTDLETELRGLFESRADEVSEAMQALILEIVRRHLAAVES